MKHYYVGVKAGQPYETFRAEMEPTEASHGHLYAAVIGPFRTKQGAQFMARYGKGNPHCQCVADAERLAKSVKEDQLYAQCTHEQHERMASGTHDSLL